MQEEILKSDAKQIVDLLFNSKVFKDTITRDHMNALEKYIQFLLSSRFDSYKKIDEIMNKVRKYEEDNKKEAKS